MRRLCSLKIAVGVSLAALVITAITVGAGGLHGELVWLQERPSNTQRRSGHGRALHAELVDRFPAARRVHGLGRSWMTRWRAHSTDTCPNAGLARST